MEGEASGPIQEELASRLEVVKPVLEEYIVAASSAREPKVSGVARLRRNLAAHCAFGEGPAVLQGTAKQLRARQRGARKSEDTGQPPQAAVRLDNSTAADVRDEHDGSSTCGTSSGFDGNSHGTSLDLANAHALDLPQFPLAGTVPPHGQHPCGLEKVLHGPVVVCSEGERSGSSWDRGVAQSPSAEPAGGAVQAQPCKLVGKKKLSDLLPSIVDGIAAIKNELVVSKISVTEEADLTDELRQLQELLVAAG
jgi:hypothetical protein